MIDSDTFIFSNVLALEKINVVCLFFRQIIQDIKFLK